MGEDTIVRKNMKRMIKAALLLTGAISLLAIALPSFLENKNDIQLYRDNDSILVTGGEETITYIGPPSPGRHNYNVDPPYDHQKPVFLDPRIFFGLFDGIRPFEVDFYYII